MPHHCHANDCPIVTLPALLMCFKHWKLVPGEMQKRVWATFKARSVRLSDNPQSWANYYEACADAVEFVAKKEGKDPKNMYRTSIPHFLALAEKKIEKPLGDR